MTSFATPTDLTSRYDWRIIAQLASDTGTADTQGAVLTDQNVLNCLADSSGTIVMFCLKGGRYSEADLLALTGNGQAFLQRLTCDIALYYIVLRRGLPVAEYPQVIEALKVLEMIGKGDLIFPIPAVIAAGVAQSPAIPIPIIAQNNFLINSVRYFPTLRFTQQQL